MKKFNRWWNYDEQGEDSMEEEHLPHWKNIMEYIDEKDILNKDILDFGCNQGGLLRVLYNASAFNKGVGIDLGIKSIEVANSRKGDYPLEFFNTSEPRDTGMKFNTVISSSVMYLINDLDYHAKIIRDCLRDNGVYYATYTDYVGNPNLPQIFKTINSYGAIKMNIYSLDDIAKAFWDNGFKVYLQRIIPTDYILIESEDKWNASIEDKMVSKYEKMYIFKFIKETNN